LPDGTFFLYSFYMKLFGSFTSPYVRRIRILCKELGIPVEMVDTMTEVGQKELREKNPLWKVPYAEVDGKKIWDSHTITDYLFETKGYGSFREKNHKDKWEEANLLNAIDQSLDNSILLFYLHKEGIDSDAAPYLTKNSLRVSSILNYLKSKLNGPSFFPDGKLGISELALYTTLDWMLFRSVLPIEDPLFLNFLKHYESRESFRETAPPRS